MSSKIPIAYIDVRVFAHATEDPDKVLTAVRNMLSAESSDKVVLRKSSLTGHHGNPIVLFQARIKDKKVAQAVFESLSSGLSILDKELFGREVTQHLEKGTLYIRLDKQSAFLNEFRFGSTDSIHFKIHFKKHSSQEIIDICRQFGLLP